MNNNNTYYELLGQHIQKFLIGKWDTQKKAAAMLGLSPDRVSKMISGYRPVNQKTMLKLQRYGFDILHFERWYGVNEIESDNLSKKEIIPLVVDILILKKTFSSLSP